MEVDGGGWMDGGAQYSGWVSRRIEGWGKRNGEE